MGGRLLRLDILHQKSWIDSVFAHLAFVQQQREERTVSGRSTKQEFSKELGNAQSDPNTNEKKRKFNINENSGNSLQK